MLSFENKYVSLRVNVLRLYLSDEAYYTDYKFAGYLLHVWMGAGTDNF